MPFLYGYFTPFPIESHNPVGSTTAQSSPMGENGVEDSVYAQPQSVPARKRLSPIQLIRYRQSFAVQPPEIPNPISNSSPSASASTTSQSAAIGGGSATASVATQTQYVQAPKHLSSIRLTRHRESFAVQLPMREHPRRGQASQYLDRVKEVFACLGQPEKYGQFLNTLRAFKGGELDIPGVINEVERLFAGQDALIEDFNVWLPPGFSCGRRQGL